MKLAFGYNTNGFAHHRLADALAVIANLGYDGVALTLDSNHLNPTLSTRREVEIVGNNLQRHKLRCVIETGGRYVLNPYLKHEPSLISSSPAGRRLRVTFLCRAIEIAAVLGAEVVSFWSGVRRADVTEAKAWKWLVEGCKRVRDYAVEKGVALGFEPEPGMFIETVADYKRLRRAIVGPMTSSGASQKTTAPRGVMRPTPDIFGLTLDVGHVYCAEREPFPKVFNKFAQLIKNVHIEDIRKRKHEHLMFGEGEIDFYKVLKAIKSSGYAGLINVELSRDSHRAPEVAARSIEFLRGIETKL